MHTQIKFENKKTEEDEEHAEERERQRNEQKKEIAVLCCLCAYGSPYLRVARQQDKDDAKRCLRRKRKTETIATVVIVRLSVSFLLTVLCLWYRRICLHAKCSSTNMLCRSSSLFFFLFLQFCVFFFFFFIFVAHFFVFFYCVRARVCVVSFIISWILN